MKKRIISLLLTVVMVLGLLPTAVFAVQETAAEAEVQTAQPIVMDFKAMAKEAAKQSWWAKLPTVYTKAGGEAKLIGMPYSKPMTGDMLDAYNALQSWLSDTYGWTINEQMSVFTTGNGNRFYLSADDDVAWGMQKWAYLIANDDRNSIVFDLQVETAGWYNLQIVASMQTDASTNFVTDYIGEAGGGYATFYVNEEAVYTDYCFIGTGTKTESLGAVWLEEGTNTLRVRNSKDIWGQQNITGRCNADIVSMTLAPLGEVTLGEGENRVVDLTQTWLAFDGVSDDAELDVSVEDDRVVTARISGTKVVLEGMGGGSSEITVTMDGEEVCTMTVTVTENANFAEPIRVDFKEFAKRAATQSWWKELPTYYTASGSLVKRVGSAKAETMTEDQVQAAKDMQAWMEENLHWSFDLQGSRLLDAVGNRIYFSARNDIPWGVARNGNINFTDGSSDLAVNVQVETAGWYDLTMEVVHESEYDKHWVSDTGINAGGAYADLYVNGEKLVTGYTFRHKTSAPILVCSFGSVYLDEGENTIALRTVGEYNVPVCPVNGWFSGRSNSNLTAMTLTPLGLTEVQEGTCRVIDTAQLLGYGTKAGELDVSASSDAVQAYINANDELVIYGLEQGRADLTVTSDGEQVAQLKIKVTEKTKLVYDFAKASSVTTDGFDEIEEFSDLDVDDVPSDLWRHNSGNAKWDANANAAALSGAGTKVSFVLDVTESGWFTPQLQLYRHNKGGRISVYLDDAYLGSVQTYATENALEDRLLRPVQLDAGEHTLTLQIDESNPQAGGTTVLRWRGFTLTPSQEPKLTIDAGDLVEKPGHVMELPITAAWEDGRMDDLYGAEISVAVSDDTALEATVTEGTKTQSTVLSVKTLNNTLNNDYVTLTVTANGVTAVKKIDVSLLETAKILSMDVELANTTTGRIPRATTRAFVFDMPGSDGAQVMPQEVDVTYTVSDPAVISVDTEKHTLNALADGEATVTVTVTQDDKVFTKTLPVTVAESGDNLLDADSSSFEGSSLIWEGITGENASRWATSEVADDGTGNRALKISINPESNASLGGDGVDVYNKNGTFAVMKPGYLYEMTFRFRVDGYKQAEGAQQHPRFMVCFYDWRSNVMGSGVHDEVNCNADVLYPELEDGVWYELSVPVRAPIEAADTMYGGLYLMLRSHYAAPGDKNLSGWEGTFWVDDIEIREVGFEQAKVELVTQPLNSSYPFKVSVKPYTTTGHEILLDEGAARNNFNLESADENVLRVEAGPTYVYERANLWTEFWTQYATYDIKLVGKNDTTQLLATCACTIGGQTRGGSLDVTIANQPEVLRDTNVRLNGVESLVLSVGSAAQATITGLTTELNEIKQEEFDGIYFASTNTSIATVDAVTGKVTAVGEGTVTITGYALWENGAVKGTATLTVTDDTDLASITVDADTDFVAEGNFLQMSVSGKKASGVKADMSKYPVAWSVDDRAVATISETGRLAAVSTGTVHVTATVGVEDQVITNTMAITVIANEELPSNIVTFSFVNGNGPRMDTATLESLGIEIDRDKTYNGFEGNEWQKTGFVFNVPVGAELYMDFMIEKSGWYKVEARGCSIYYYGCLTGFYIDDHYVGSPDFGADTASNYDGGGVFNTIYLEAGKHTMRLQAEEARRILLGEVTMYPVADPNEVSFEAAPEKDTLIRGEKTKLALELWDGNQAKYYLHYETEDPDYTNYYTVTSSDPSVVSVSNDLFDTYLTAGKEGTATITVKAEILGETVTRQFAVGVVNGQVASAELTAEFTTVRPDVEDFPLSVKAFGLSGEIALPEDVNVTYESADTSIATVSADGIVSLTGKEGSVQITAHLTEGSRTLQLPIWITVSSGKTEPTIYTWEERANAQENVTKYSWAWNMKEAVVAQADYYVEHLEQIYNMWPAEGLPRSAKITYHWDEFHAVCAYCKTNVQGTYGDYYQWLADPIENPWKITCPACHRDFPSNDFGSFYQCGLDERGVFTVERAMANGGEQFLVNELYPEMGEGWGVDNGFGYFTGEYDTQGRERVRTYIAYYMHQMMYVLSEHTGKNAMPTIFDKLREAYLYTGDEKYGSAGAILLDRMADIYPGYSLHYYKDIAVTTSLNSGSRGKIADLTWECVISQSIAKAADAFWPCADNPDVVEFLRKYADRKGVAAEDITPQYLRTNVDNGILREIADAVQRDQIDGNFGMHQASMALAAVALDTMPETQQWIDWVFKTGKIGGLYNEGWNLGGDVNRVLIELVDRDGFGNEGSIGYNYLWLSNLLDLADALNGYEKAEQYDLWSHPKFVNMYKAFMPLTICGRMTVNVHETPTTWQHLGTMGSVEHLMTAYQGSGDREIAQMLYSRNGNSVNGLHGNIFTKNPESGIRSQIQQIINEDGQWNMNESTWLAGAGEAIGILRRGPEIYVAGVNEHEFFDTWMNFGLTNTHTHWEAMNLELDAFGLPLNGNMGYPESMTGDSYERLQWNQHTVSNNTVLVNDEPQEPNPEAGFPLHFDGENDKVKVMDANSPNSYDAADIYRRTVLTVQGDNGIDYTVDFFRILGGSEHVYSFHGATRIQPTTQGLTLAHQPFGTYAGADVPYGDYDYSGYGAAAMNQPCGYSWLNDVYRDEDPSATFYVDWEIEDQQHQLSTSKGIHMRLTMVNDKPMAEVALANGEPSDNGTTPDHIEFMLVRNSGTQNLDTLFSSVIEPYQTEIQVKSVELADVTLLEGTEHPTDRVRVLKVTLNSGRVDYIVYATNPDCTYRVAELFDFSGFVGVCSYRDGKLVYAYGNEATKVANVIENAQSKLTGTVVDFSKELTLESSMTVTMNEDYAAEDLTDKYIYVNNDGLENAVYRIYGAERNADGTITLDMHTQDFIREWVDEWNFDLGYLYNIAEGQTYTIPLSSTFDALAFFNHTSDQVIKAGNKLSLTTGVAGLGVTYEADGMPKGMKIAASNGLITWTTSKTQMGRYPITVKAVDTDGDVLAAMSFTVYVVSYSGSSYAQDVCAHAKAVTYTVDGIIETVCPACGLITKIKEEDQIVKFDLAGANMTLGNELRLNIMAKTSDLTDGTYTAKITHNGETTEQTFVKYNSTYHCVTVSVCAKQMADAITVEVFDEKGNAVSNVYETSVRDYAMRALANSATSAKIKTLAVDMLNYGAEAQTYFGYNTTDLANNRLTAEQQALATAKVSCSDERVKGNNYYGSNLSLEDRILLNLFFKNVTSDMYAEITFTDYRGEAKTITVDELVKYSGSTYKVVVDDIVLADSFCPVTVTVYNADGTVHGTATDSVESYVARGNNVSIYEAILKFAYSARQYLS